MHENLRNNKKIVGITKAKCQLNNCTLDRHLSIEMAHKHILLPNPMGVDYVVVGFNMKVQPLDTHNAALPLCVSAICIDVMSNHLLLVHVMSAVGIDVVSIHKLFAYRDGALFA